MKKTQIFTKVTLLLGTLFICASMAYADMSGTGFFVSADGYIATNNHVIDGATSIQVRLKGGKTLAAKIIRVDRKNDLAIIKINGDGYKSLQIQSSSNIKRGEKVYAMGFPQTQFQGIEPKLTDGLISSLSGIADEPTTFQISNPIQPGNSGGPLFTESGRVVGIVVSSLSTLALVKATGSLPQNINYAVKSNYLIELLNTIDNQKFQNQKSTFNYSSSKKLVDIVEAIEQGVVIIQSETYQKPTITKAPSPPPPPTYQPPQQSPNNPSTAAYTRTEADEACVRMGFDRNTSKYATCVNSLMQTNGTTNQPSTKIAYTRQEADEACVRMGFDRNTSKYATCVNSLMNTR